MCELITPMAMVGGTCLLHVSDAQHEAYCVQDIRFTRPIETGDRIKRRVPTSNSSPNGIRFET